MSLNDSRNLIDGDIGSLDLVRQERKIDESKTKWQDERVTPFKGQDFYEIRKNLLNSGELFEDPEFEASDEVLYYDDEHEEETQEENRRSNDENDQTCEEGMDSTSRGLKKKKRKAGAENATREWSYEWLRPNQIVDKPKFSGEEYSRFQVKQGGLGDCWFVASVASLIDKKKFLNRVVCADNSFDDENYAGIFHFRFWRFGEWVDVVIDDRLPTKDKKLVYTEVGDNDEFWTALLEKAYAKFRGNYRNIDGGHMEIAFQDFTGGIIETHKLTDTPENAVNFFQSKLNRNALIGTGIGDENCIGDQLPAGHAYTITGAKMHKNIPLIRIRNPWGEDTEWKGAWSDESAKWNSVSKSFKTEIGFKKKGDGEFWMSYRDFIKYFHDVTICNLTPNENEAETATKKWGEVQFKGEWVRGITAGGATESENFHRNPQYLLTVYEPGEEDIDGLNSVVISLLQKEYFPLKDFLSISFEVYRVKNQELDQKPMKKNFFEENAPIKMAEYSIMQETYVRLELKPGKYLVIPSTYEQDTEGEFLIRVFADNKFKFEEYDMPITKVAVREEIENVDLIDVIFSEFSTDDDDMDFLGLKQILSRWLGSHNTSKEFCRSLIALATKKKSRKITVEQLKLMLDEIGKWITAYKYARSDDEILEKLQNGEDLSDLSSKLFAKILDHTEILQIKIKSQSEGTIVTEDERDELLTSFQLPNALQLLGLSVNKQILNSLVLSYGNAENKILLCDFFMCILKTKTLLENFTDAEILAMDQRTLKAIL